ncbi:MAG TPA: hypothetical protein VLT35_03395, partial [Methanocella sp.]|nr:hypothetical protein [Methanocella sp.]
KAAGQAMGIGVSPDSGHAVVAIWAGSFAPVLDLQSQSLLKGISLNGRSYQAVAYSPDGGRVYLSHYDGSRIVVLDASSFTVIDYIPVAPRPTYIAITPDGTQLYVAHEGGDVEVIGLPGGGRIRTFDLNAHTKFMSIAFSTPAV